MPTCFCTVHGCRDSGGVDPLTTRPKGRELSTRIHKSHQVDERVAMYNMAEERATEVLEEQIEDISEYLAATMVADEVSSCSQRPGGRLWARSDNFVNEVRSPMSSKNSLSSKDKAHTPLPQSGSRRSREAIILSCLADVECEIQQLIGHAQPRLNNLKLPSNNSEPSPFPLLDLITQSSNLRAELDNITNKAPAVITSKQAVCKKLDLLDERLVVAKKEWNCALVSVKQEYTPVHGIMYDTAHHFLPILENADPILQVAFFMILTCQVLLGVSRRGCTFLLNMVQYVIQLALVRSGRPLSTYDQKLMADIPRDFRSVNNHFPLDSKHTTYAVCPNPDCHATYKPSFLNGSPIPSYDRICTHRQFPRGKKCGTTLLRPRRVGGQLIHIPIKPFVAYSFMDWVGGLLSRPGIEEKMDGSWKPGTRATEQMRDIFDGDILKEFNGPDGERHFCNGEGEGRYAFSLCVDFFNPLGNKQAGKKKSVGLVSLVCLNLPPELRYKPENMFLYGVIPGPNEPPLDCLNHYLRYLVDELEEFWDPGVRYTRTYEHYYGRVVRCALVCVVCDLPAARKTIGFGSIKHTQMCAFCHCTRTSHGLGNTSIHTWRRRTNEEYRRDAARYADACDAKDRKDVFSETGIRYSELLRLPYFDPSQFVVVDAMHNLFLGLIQEHFEILGMKLEETPEDSVVLDIPIRSEQFQSLEPNEQKSMRNLIKLLESPLKEALQSPIECKTIVNKLMTYHLNTLKLACELLEVPLLSRPPNKKKVYKADYAKALVDWRRKKKEFDLATNFQKGSILTPSEVKEIRSDIQRMITPSWLTSVPSNLGEPGHGKLKADQWRTVGTLYLPVSLVRMWGHEENASMSRRKKMLHATLSLISAVIIASSHTTSHAKADLYLQHMQAYITGIRDLVPNYQFRPNHHAALHLSEYLRFYGPVHAWWTFPFERLIGLLQRTPTNFKQGELEQTISKSFVQSANLRCLLSKDSCPTAIRHCQSHFTKLTDSKVRNSLLMDISTFLADPENDPLTEASPLDIPTFLADPENHHTTKTNARTVIATYIALRIYFGEAPPSLKNLSCVTINGLTYATVRRHHGNSSVLIRRPLPVDEAIPAQIEDIIQTVDDETLFAVRYYRKRVRSDPFKLYPYLQVSLWEQELGHVAIVHSADIVSHFARLDMKWNSCDHIAVISLSREY